MMTSVLVLLMPWVESLRQALGLVSGIYSLIRDKIKFDYINSIYFQIYKFYVHYSFTFYIIN